MQVEFAEKVNYTLIAQIAGIFVLILLLTLYWNRKIIQARKQAETQKTKLEDLARKLSRYLSPQIYDMLFTGGDKAGLSSERKKLTIFFSDIAGFTNISEQLESEDLTDLLNYYLTEMSDIALKYGGTIDKYIGDAIVIFFGDPTSNGTQEDPIRCVQMAMEMNERLAAMKAEGSTKGLSSDFNIRMGIHTGYCTVGNIGSTSRMDYTIVGKAVNIASRLETNAPINSILISQDTQDLIKDIIECEPLELLQLKGLSQEVRAFLVKEAKVIESVG